MPNSRPKRPLYLSAEFRVALFAVVLGGIVFAVSRLDLHPDLKHMHIAMLSGAPEGNYHAMVDELAGVARAHGGQLDNVGSAGSTENVARLATSKTTCDVAFGLAQGGREVPPGVVLIGRLAKAESVFLLGKDADKITNFSDLRGLRIGTGPEQGGSAKIAKVLFESDDLAPLGVKLSNQTLEAELDLAEKGDLDLALVVMDEDAALVKKAVRDRGLQIAGFPHADVVARRFPYLRTGRIGAGQYDAVRMLPAEDKRVLRVDTFVVGNGCPSRSQTIGLLMVLAEAFPDFVRHNKETPNTSGLLLSPVSKAFFDHDGPELVDEYLPRIGDVMPPSNWVHVVMGVSVLFNLMGLANRFRLWRIDAARVHAEHAVEALFGRGTTLGDIARIAAGSRPELAADVTRIIQELEELAERSRKQSLSVLVPMGQEMAYRYQEALMHKTLSVLRAFVEHEKTET